VRFFLDISCKFDSKKGRTILWWRIIIALVPLKYSLKSALLERILYSDPNIRYISTTSCGFLSRLALLLVTLFLNFVAASPTNCAYKLTGSCTKFHKTCLGKRSSFLPFFPLFLRPTETSMRPTMHCQWGPRFSPVTVWFIQKMGDIHLVALKAQPATKYHGLESLASLFPSVYSNQRHILACSNLI